MLLVIDVGNTNTVLGLYDGETLVQSFRMSTDKNRSSDEIGMFIMQVLMAKQLDFKQIESVIIASVVPPVMHSLENAIKKYLNITPYVVTSKTPLGMKILIDNPKELGTDRLVNAFAAQYIYGGPVIIIDLGTATTFCAVNENGDYLGGAIYPGLKISVDALVEKTAKLPRVEITEPESAIGKNTISAMQSGLYYGYAGMIDYLVEKFKQELSAPNAKVVATGGLAKLIASESKAIEIINRDLTLEGLKLIHEKLNMKKKDN
ncbi:MAG: type III pantothenate kinase [Clostridia bacterium]|nr:type III pantothenate kinase [Clostridia bacterium]MBR6646749.1 type III pantothenate kinase [Clostridia bacterium]